MIRKRINTDLFIRGIKFVDKLTGAPINLDGAIDVKLFVRRQMTSRWIEQYNTLVAAVSDKVPSDGLIKSSSYIDGYLILTV